MTDIVERLRAHKEARLSIASGLHEHDTPTVCRDAAAEITRLRAEVAALREVAYYAVREFRHSAREIYGMTNHIEGADARFREASEILMSCDKALTSTAPTAEAHDRRARNEALEEAAKVADDFPKTYGPKPPEGRKRFSFDELSAYSRAACRMVGEDIRALKEDG